MRFQTTIRDSSLRKELLRLARKQGDNLNDVVRKALGLYVWAMKKQQAGQKIVAVDTSGKTAVAVATVLDLDA